MHYAAAGFEARLAALEAAGVITAPTIHVVDMYAEPEKVAAESKTGNLVCFRLLRPPPSAAAAAVSESSEDEDDEEEEGAVRVESRKCLVCEAKGKGEVATAYVCLPCRCRVLCAGCAARMVQPPSHPTIRRRRLPPPQQVLRLLSSC